MFELLLCCLPWPTPSYTLQWKQNDLQHISPGSDPKFLSDTSRPAPLVPSVPSHTVGSSNPSLSGTSVSDRSGATISEKSPPLVSPVPPLPRYSIPNALLSRTSRKNPTIVIFSASYCEPCKAIQRDLSTLSPGYPSSTVLYDERPIWRAVTLSTLLSVPASSSSPNSLVASGPSSPNSPGPSSSPAPSLSVSSRAYVPHIVVVDQEQLFSQFNVTALPTVLLLSPEGTELSRHVGYISPTALSKFYYSTPSSFSRSVP